MVERISHRAWLLALIGASLLTSAPRFLTADSDSDDPRGDGQQERFHERRDGHDREEREEHRHQQRDDRDEGMRQERERKPRNMHPELQIAAPFNRSSDS